MPLCVQLVTPLKSIQFTVQSSLQVKLVSSPPSVQERQGGWVWKRVAVKIQTATTSLVVPGIYRYTDDNTYYTTLVWRHIQHSQETPKRSTGLLKTTNIPPGYRIDNRHCTQNIIKELLVDIFGFFSNGHISDNT